MYWIDWIRGWLAPALDWFEAHPGIASWLQAVGSIGAIVFRLSVRPGRRARSHEDIDRIRKPQGLSMIVQPEFISG